MFVPWYLYWCCGIYIDIIYIYWYWYIGVMVFILVICCLYWSHCIGIGGLVIVTCSVFTAHCYSPGDYWGHLPSPTFPLCDDLRHESSSKHSLCRQMRISSPLLGGATPGWIKGDQAGMQTSQCLSYSYLQERSEGLEAFQTSWSRGRRSGWGGEEWGW